MPKDRRCFCDRCQHCRKLNWQILRRAELRAAAGAIERPAVAGRLASGAGDRSREHLPAAGRQLHSTAANCRPALIG
jgi:hypothetical protein